MKVLMMAAVLSIFLLFFAGTAFATPSLHSPQPANNTFLKGGSQIISINATSGNLNSSSVILHIISLNAYEQGEAWDNHTLTCTNTLTEWECSKTLSFVIAGSDTAELFYFEAKDDDGTSGNSGTATNPLRFTLDRNPPAFSFSNPTNNSYARGNEDISITVTDASSGVDNNTVQYSADGSSWTTMKNTSLNSFEATWGTTGFSNNQTVNLQVRASDDVGNNGTARINVTVDNEAPRLAVLSSLTGNLSGGVNLQVNVNDSYSGVNLANVRYNVSSMNGALGCTGTNYSATCSATLDTTQLQDGDYNITFSVTDYAGNTNSTYVGITTKNSQPSISIAEPSNNAFLKGNITAKASLVNTGGVSSVELSVEQGSNITTYAMSCNSNITSCNYSVNASSFADGGYTIKAKALNNLNLEITSSISVSIDNTKPTLTIIQPTGTVKGDAEVKADVVEGNMNQNKVWFNISSAGGSLACTPQTPSKFTCSTTFNSKQLGDGGYTLTVSAEDKAGNLATASKSITVTNGVGGSGSSGGGNSGGSASGNETTEIVPKETKGISLPFKADYILVGVVIGSVVVVIVILVLIVIHRSGKTIITEE